MVMKQFEFQTYLEKLMVVIMLVTALLMAFFKPAVSIGMGALVFLSLVRFFAFNKNEVWENLKKIDPPLIFLYVFFLLWLVLSVFWGNDVDEAFKRFQRFSGLLMIPLIIGINADLIQNHWRQIIKAAVISCSVAAMPTFWFFIFPEQVPIGDGYSFLFKELEAPRDYFKFGAYSPFLDRLYFGYLCGFCLLGMLYMWMRDKKPGSFHWSLLLLIPLLIILGARGAQLAFSLAVVAGVLYFLSGKRKAFNSSEKKAVSKYVLLASSMLAAAMLLVLVVQSPRYAQIHWEWSEVKQNPTDHEAMAEHTVILRLISWRHNLKLIKERPLTGFGIGDYVRTMEISYEKEGIELPVHTNQQFLFFGVVGGLPGFISFFLFFLLSAWYAWKRMKAKPARIGVVAIWIYMLVVMLFDSPLNYHMPAFLFLSVWMGVLFGGDGDWLEN